MALYIPKVNALAMFICDATRNNVNSIKLEFLTGLLYSEAKATNIL